MAGAQPNLRTDSQCIDCGEPIASGARRCRPHAYAHAQAIGDRLTEWISPTPSQGAGAEVALLRFCDRVARTYRIDAERGHPANIFDLRQYMDKDSESFFFRIAAIVDRELCDLAMRSFNQDVRERWRRSLGVRLVGAETGVVRRMIQTLQMERVLIEHGLAESAFRFSGGG